MPVRYRGMPEPEPKQLLRLEKPKHLEGFASEHWDTIEPLLAEMGLLREIDIEALTALCQWWLEYRTLQATPATDSSETYKRSIALASAFKNWSNLAGRFGLTPKDREKLTLVPPQEYSPVTDYLA